MYVLSAQRAALFGTNRGKIMAGKGKYEMRTRETTPNGAAKSPAKRLSSLEAKTLDTPSAPVARTHSITLIIVEICGLFQAILFFFLVLIIVVVVDNVA